VTRSQEPAGVPAPSAETIAKIEAYAVSVANRIQENWRRPRGAGNGFECVIRLTQDPDGTVTSFEIERCNGNKKAQRSVEEAVLAASPLPLPSDPTIFDPVVRVTFRPTIE
jgi:colicin import membrane protein